MPSMQRGGAGVIDQDRLAWVWVGPLTKRAEITPGPWPAWDRLGAVFVNDGRFTRSGGLSILASKHTGDFLYWLAATAPPVFTAPFGGMSVRVPVGHTAKSGARSILELAASARLFLGGPEVTRPDGGPVLIDATGAAWGATAKDREAYRRSQGLTLASRVIRPFYTALVLSGCLTPGSARAVTIKYRLGNSAGQGIGPVRRYVFGSGEFSGDTAIDQGANYAGYAN